MDYKPVLWPVLFIVLGVLINAVVCPLFLVGLTLGLQHTGYLSPPQDPGQANQELIGAAIFVSIIAAITSIVMLSITALLVWLLKKTISTGLAAAVIALTVIINLVLSYLFLLFLIGMHST